MERNLTLDYFKIILSICVILVHVPFVSIYRPETSDFFTQAGYILGWQITHSLGRIAVPLFFIINGFFLNLEDKDKFIKYIVKLIKLYLVWAIFYLPCYYPYLDFKSSCIIFITGYFQLWYFPCLIGAAIILFLLNKVKMSNIYILGILSIILFIIGYLIQQKDPYDNFEMLKYRNFLFFGFPMVALGVIIRKINVDSIKKYLPFLIVIFSVCLFVESYIYMDQQKVYNLYFSCFLICPVLFIYALVNGKYKIDSSNGVIPLLSSAVFYIHPIIIRWTSLLFEIDAVSFPYIVVVSFIAAHLIIQVNKIFKIFL